MSRFKDFDQLWAESKREPVSIRVFGEVHNLPASIPAGIILRISRLQAEAGDAAAIPDHEVVGMAEALFTKHRLDRWVEQGLTIDQLGDLIKFAMSAYTGVDPDAGGSENPQ